MSENYKTLGFMFDSTGNRLSKNCKYISEEEQALLPADTGNKDRIYIYCTDCEEFMRYEAGDEASLNGRWICDNCGKTVKEETPYDRLGDINDAFEA